jgi:hypothetical protein
MCFIKELDVDANSLIRHTPNMDRAYLYFLFLGALQALRHGRN